MGSAPESGSHLLADTCPKLKHDTGIIESSCRGFSGSLSASAEKHNSFPSAFAYCMWHYDASQNGGNPSTGDFPGAGLHTCKGELL